MGGSKACAGERAGNVFEREKDVATLVPLKANLTAAAAGTHSSLNADALRARQ